MKSGEVGIVISSNFAIFYQATILAILHFIYILTMEIKG